VNVRLTLSNESAEGTYSTDYATGSGFAVNPTGTIVTASHVVSPAPVDMRTFATNKLFVDKFGLKIPSGGSLFDTYHVSDDATYNHRLHQCYRGVICKFTTTPVVSVYTPADLADGQASNPLAARVLKSTGFDKTDIAALQVAASNMPTVALAQTVDGIDPGEPVTAIGFAGTSQNLPSNGEPDLKDGAVSNVRTVGADKQLEIDVEIEEGMSGGPVVNRSAQVVGVTSYYLARSNGQAGTKFARSIDDVHEVLEALGKKASRGQADTAYERAMSLFWGKHYKDAIPLYDKVLSLSSGQPFARKYRARAEALLDESVPLGSSGFPWWGYALIAAGAIAVIGLVVALVVAGRGRRPKPAVPVSAQPPPAVLPGAPEPVPVAPAVAPPVTAPEPAAEPPGPPEPEPSSLVFADGPLAGRRVEIQHELVLGRENVDVLVEDPEVSRRHAVVRPVEGGIEIDDLGSSNGTFVNGVRVREPRVLRDGDEIRLGSVGLRVDVPARAQATVIAQTRGNPGFPHEPPP
jgi:serine protease Do